MTSERAPSAPSEYARIAKVLGGQSVLRRKVISQLDAHDVVVKGMSGGAVLHLLEATSSLGRGELASALGMSLRTLQRLTADKPLSIEHSSRAWKFAEILEHATRVFGTRAAAERWLSQPVTALDRQVPIELMKTGIGTDMVEDLLGRLEYGVFT
jgi:putative toxin-antitoxin system antitoxin component (TIGR02293 family)